MIKKFITLFFFPFVFIFLSVNCYSVEPEEFLKNKKQEYLARKISKNIRCLVCQNQSIDESDATLAKDFRILIRKKIKEGKSEKEIYNFLTARYGDFILLNPPLNKSTYLLWFLPVIFLLAGIYVIYKHNKIPKKL
tara:strand:+ start:235 stop:642 length:408 start_codon:yes stop_codon:yes gene_type:complete